MIRLRAKQEEMRLELERAKNKEEETKAAGDDPSKDVPKPVRILGVGRGKRTAGTKAKKRTPGELRIQKDIAELDGGDIATVSFPDTNDLTLFNVKIAVDTGYWNGAAYDFSFKVPPMYPHEPPKVRCGTKIYHPNIDFSGNICLNILREDWNPVLDINSVIYGLIFLMYEPNTDEPLNREAAELLRRNPSDFEAIVRRSLKGERINGIDFERFIY